tara:strand:+ start:4462 stop:4902 length:441 start_codon:yes stop_codon:yes gene_type:complete
MNENGDEAIRICTEIASKTDNQEICDMACRAANLIVAIKDGRRSESQNNSLHLWLSQVATILNDAGIDQILFLEKLAGKAEIPNTTISLKERFWKPILKAMTEKESTTEMNTKDPDVIYQTACRILSTNFGIVPPPWPSHTREDLR